MQSGPLYTLQTPMKGLILVKDGLEADGAFLVPYSLHAALQEGLQVRHDSTMLALCGDACP